MVTTTIAEGVHIQHGVAELAFHNNIYPIPSLFTVVTEDTTAEWILMATSLVAMETKTKTIITTTSDCDMDSVC